MAIGGGYVCGGIDSRERGASVRRMLAGVCAGNAGGAEGVDAELDCAVLFSLDGCDVVSEGGCGGLCVIVLIPAAALAAS